MPFPHPVQRDLDDDVTTTTGLTRRETQVLALTAQGSSNRDIARDLGVSEHTVKFHLGAVYRKLSVHNRTEAAVTYFRLNGSES